MNPPWFNFIAQTSPIPFPTGSANWENLIPWILSAVFGLLSWIIYYVLVHQKKAIDDLTASQEKMNSRQDKMSNALLIVHKERLLEWVADQQSPILQQKAATLVKEIDEAVNANS